MLFPMAGDRKLYNHKINLQQLGMSSYSYFTSPLLVPFLTSQIRGEGKKELAEEGA